MDGRRGNLNLLLQILNFLGGEATLDTDGRLVPAMDTGNPDRHESELSQPREPMVRVEVVTVYPSNLGTAIDTNVSGTDRTP